MSDPSVKKHPKERKITRSRPILEMLRDGAALDFDQIVERARSLHLVYRCARGRVQTYKAVRYLVRAGHIERGSDRRFRTIGDAVICPIQKKIDARVVVNARLALRKRRRGTAQ